MGCHKFPNIDTSRPQCCGKRLMGPQKGGVAAAGFGNAHETIDSCSRDLAEAIAKEDFLCAYITQQRA